MVVIGFGMVAHSFVDKLLEYDENKQYAVTIIGEEPHVAYNRVGLTQFFNNQSIWKPPQSALVFLSLTSLQQRVELPW